MKFAAGVLVCLAVIIQLAAADFQSNCMEVEVSSRVECGFPGITADACRAKGCCFDNTRRGKWCFVAPGTSYIRWGRKTCPSNTKVIYTGRTAGPRFNQDGSGSNYLCLSDAPQFVEAKNPLYSGYIWGMEYEIFPENDNVFSFANNNGNPITQSPVPCVACLVTGRTTELMIPARRECPTGWTQEYRGFLVSETRGLTRYRTSFICMDEAPEGNTGPTNQDQGTIYPVRVGCGTLPCDAYIADREVTCTVCTI